MISQIPGFISGVSITLIGLLIPYLLQRYRHFKKIRKTFQFNKSLNDLKSTIEDVYVQFNLGHTLLITPRIPGNINVSRKHSHYEETGYFNYLIDNNIREFIFKYWDKSDKRFMKFSVNGNSIDVDMFLYPHEIKELTEILKNKL